MFLHPHHFQQHDRWLEHFVEARGAPLRNHPWGFTELVLDRELLAIGKVSLRTARGVFADGTPFDVPAVDDAPSPLDLDESVRDQVIYLSLPVRRPGAPEFDRNAADATFARYRHDKIEMRDANVDNALMAPVEIAKPRLRLLRTSDPRQDYVTLGVARVVEVRADKTVVLDERYIPPLLDCQASAFLKAFMAELLGMLAQRGQAVAGRLSGAARGTVADVTDLVMLLLINRHEPVVAHLQSIRGVHPEEFYRQALSLAGESSALTTTERRPAVLPPYRHDDLQATFVPLIDELRRAFSTVRDERAIPILLEEKKHGIRIGRIGDRSLVGTARFVLAVGAAVPADDTRRRFPAQSKVGAPEHISQMVNLQLPGIALNPLPQVPREVPYFANYVYFELEPRHDQWGGIKTVGALALHVGGDWPELKLECWAIRR